MLPWFDRPDALALLDTRRRTEHLSDAEFEGLRHWVREGYLTVPSAVGDADIDAMLTDLDRIWEDGAPIPGLHISDLRLRDEDPPGLTHAQLLAVPRDARERLRREQRWRLHGFWQQSPATNRVFQHAGLRRWASLILERDASPAFTINFAFGSRQSLHQDTTVFFVAPTNALVGAWLACEDIHRDSGPLVIYPGSHREPMFHAFADYPRTNLKNCRPEWIAAYHEHLDRAAERYERVAYTPTKGEALLWHGMLIHGGDEIRDPSRSRRSYVCHYIPPGSNKDAEAVGPFNW